MSTTTDIDLSLFCDPLSGKYDLAEPFVIGRWEYAASSQMAIRRPTDKPETTGRKLPPVVAIFTGFKADGAYVPDATPAWDELAELCPSCNGLNVKPDDWDEEDEGEWTVDDNDDCSHCHGYGRVLYASCERLGGRLIRTPNAQRMRRLPGLRVCRLEGTGRESDWLRFVFDGGGQGVVCPVVRDEKAVTR